MSGKEYPFRPLPGDEDLWFLLDHIRLGASLAKVDALETYLAVRHAGHRADRGHTWTHQGSRPIARRLHSPPHPARTTGRPSTGLGAHGVSCAARWYAVISIAVKTIGKPRLLYVSPVVPAMSGNGLAMRAGAILVALARHYAVTLLVAPIYHPGYASDSHWIDAWVERAFHLGLPPELDPDERFDIVHVFRLAALPYAEPWLRDMDTTAGQLDLDEVESVSRRGIAALLRQNGDVAAALREARATEQARAREDEVLNRFDRIFVASEVDRDALLGRGRAEIVVLPNSLPLPPITPAPPPVGAPFTLLFVGTLGYPPNADAARFAAQEVLPRLQTGSERPVILRIVGVGAGAAVRQLDTLPGVEVIGEAPDVSPWYRDAHVAIAPLRAGGATRIKVLEAFAHMRPVVTTTIGIEGIAAESERHVLVGDDAATFATACLRLMRDPKLAERLASDAFALLSRDYSSECLARIVATFVPPRWSSGGR